MHLLFTNESGHPISKRLFTSLLKKAQQLLPPIPEGKIELILVDDAAMQTINRQSRGIDKPTDVLSFANREVKGPAVDSTSLGQIFISLPAAARNAEEMQQSLEEELRFLFVHGLLHNLGYDHQAREGEIEMMTLAYEILGRLAYGAH